MEGFFNWLGTLIGETLRWIIDLLVIFFSSLRGSLEGFIGGLSDAMGINPTLFSLLLLIVGVWMLYCALRALLARRLIATLIWAFLGLVVLSWLIGR
ncbi:hypothetical protein SAMN05192555_104257 [Franzmannia pantelleriensis]|uniref:Uncharacterized protein n=1 Tax=Franzmannia pantelleriensis TaxID=48727 RepID=A0A1G9K6B6_9GAMM|nr:hypothetical protein [Halomonas pantelleriensis]SDL45311.1 hypothetical protein SAMN05192555_104257 [Halomonas pantelleriensis]